MEADIVLSWIDPRLKFKNYSADDRITIRRESEIFFWRPDIYIKSEKGIIYEQFPEKLSGTWIFPDGRVIYFSRFVLSLTSEGYTSKSRNTLLNIPTL